MSHCHDESHHHDHDHSHAGHSHDHSNDINPALQSHLYTQIDFDGIRTLNEVNAGSGRKIVEKTWAQRLDPEPEVESDADEQLIIHVPFTGQTRLHSLHLRTSPTPSAPSTLKLYHNTEDLDFTNILDAKPTQTFTLSSTAEIQDILVKRQLFNACRSLTLFFESNFATEAGEDEEVTRCSYVGFKGDFMRLSREPVEFLYESAARPSDHKVEGRVGAGMGSSGLGGGGGGPGY